MQFLLRRVDCIQCYKLIECKKHIQLVYHFSIQFLRLNNNFCWWFYRNSLRSIKESMIEILVKSTWFLNYLLESCVLNRFLDHLLYVADNVNSSCIVPVIWTIVINYFDHFILNVTWNNVTSSNRGKSLNRWENPVNRNEYGSQYLFILNFVLFKWEFDCNNPLNWNEALIIKSQIESLTFENSWHNSIINEDSSKQFQLWTKLNN